jgi:hypothetical protein
MHHPHQPQVNHWQVLVKPTAPEVRTPSLRVLPSGHCPARPCRLPSLHPFECVDGPRLTPLFCTKHTGLVMHHFLLTTPAQRAYQSADQTKGIITWTAQFASSLQLTRKSSEAHLEQSCSRPLCCLKRTMCFQRKLFTAKAQGWTQRVTSACVALCVNAQRAHGLTGSSASRVCNRMRRRLGCPRPIQLCAKTERYPLQDSTCLPSSR